MTSGKSPERFYVLGVPIDFLTADKDLQRALAACLGHQRPPLMPGESASERVPTVHIELSETGPGPQHSHFRTPAPHQLEIEGPGFHGRADAATGSAQCSVSPAALADHRLFQHTIVATLTLFLVTRLDRQPFHAAALQLAGRGVLLTGPGGSGKSTLAYAAARRGWDVLTDDAVYLQSTPALRIWTRPAPLHLAPDTTRWFSELDGQTPILRDNGKWKLQVPAAGVARTLNGARVCLLQPAVGAPHIETLPAADALTALLRNREPGFSVFADTIEPVLRALLQPDGAWLLRTGSDPRVAIDTLEQKLRELQPG